ncbi:hypothetical protein MPLDJ20_220007 [Mesorhizobium plurifarium]|uniref:Uncharacterized protein n=1 Tax=Mesorhizobium plurifarium TaxID=69974 RepID=A0A090F2N5_MESPL|nr:hypothetical protein MPLDJ20_220007 [Mesorhizobium plurifarium]
MASQSVYVRREIAEAQPEVSLCYLPIIRCSHPDSSHHILRKPGQPQRKLATLPQVLSHFENHALALGAVERREPPRPGGDLLTDGNRLIGTHPSRLFIRLWFHAAQLSMMQA